MTAPYKSRDGVLNSFVKNHHESTDSFTKQEFNGQVKIMINFTSEKSEEMFTLSGCSLIGFKSEGSKCSFNAYFFVSVNFILSVVSLSGNTLILIALQKQSSLHPPSKLLFRCLSCTDLFAGLLSQPMFTPYLMTIANKNSHLCEIFESLAYISSALLCGESIITLTTISVDRLLALLLRLRYRQAGCYYKPCTFGRNSYVHYKLRLCHDLFVE